MKCNTLSRRRVCMKPVIYITVAALLPLVAVAADKDTPEHSKRVDNAAGVLSEILNAGDQSIPDDLLRKATCVGVVPNLKRAGFIIGAKYGKGVITCRVANGSGWSGPSAIRIEGGNIGL